MADTEKSVFNFGILDVSRISRHSSKVNCLKCNWFGSEDGIDYEGLDFLEDDKAE